MKDPHAIAFLIPLTVSIAATTCTILIHSLPLSATVDFVRREKRRGHVGVGFWTDTKIVARVIAYALVAHLIEMAVWAMLFVMCGEFTDFGAAFYHSAVNYTSLGYGDLIMSPRWRLLGPLETTNGMLLFGVSTALIFAVIQRLVGARYSDLRGQG